MNFIEEKLRDRENFCNEQCSLFSVFNEMQQLQSIYTRADSVTREMKNKLIEKKQLSNKITN